MSKKGKSGAKHPARIVSALLCVILFLSGCSDGPGDPGDLPLSDRISNCGKVIAGIRTGLRDHARTITISFDYGSDIYDELNGVIDDWVEAALAETGLATEGDYIRYQYGGYTYNSSCSVSGGRWSYTVELTPEYFTYLTQEEAVTETVKELLKEFSFRRKTSDEEKIRTIYEYLCRTVSYDKVHHKNPYYHGKSTAYAALVRHTATCQGYCAALYRLLRESGVNCRIVTGAAAGEELHAWVIAEMDGAYYNLDPTWDAGQEEYRYFLKGTAEFADHVPADQFLTEEFMRRYPMAEQSRG